MVLAAAETSLLLQLDEVADYVVGMNEVDFASEFEKGPINVPVEKKRAPSPRDVKEFHTFADEKHNSNRDTNFRSTQQSRTDIYITGASSYRAFLAENVIKTDALQAGVSNYSREYTFENFAAKAKSSQTKKFVEADFIRTGAYLGDAIKMPKCSDNQTGETLEPFSSRDGTLFSRSTVTSSTRRAIAIVLLCAWLISRFALPTTLSSLLNDVNMQAETVIIKNTRSEGSSAASVVEIEEAIIRSAPDLIAVEQKNSQAAMPAAMKQQSPQQKSLSHNKMRRHRGVKRDELQPTTGI